MVTYQELHATVASTGIWDGGRQTSHGFVLSPDVFEMSRVDADKLAELGRAVNECLLGISRVMAIVASNLAGRNVTYRYINRLLGRGAMLNLSRALKPGALPMLRKVDLVPGEDGNLWIAEIDATNPRSWGYSLIGRALCRTIHPEATMLGGVVPFIAEQLKRRGVNELVFLYGHTQRFYAPEFAVLARELSGYGITMHVLDEIDVAVQNGTSVVLRETLKKLPPMFVDFPAMNHNKPLIDALKVATEQGQAQFLIPPKYFLGSKAMLALLSNAAGDEALEHLLLTQIEPRQLVVVRRHLPPTFVVEKKMPPGIPAHTVLKRAVSSGMKQVWFSDGPGFDDALENARSMPGNFVLQQRVQPAPFAFASYNRQGELKPPRDWFVRLTAYLSHKGVEDVAVTARTDVRVHGAQDAILTGTVIV